MRASGWLLTAHGYNFDSLKMRQGFKELLDIKAFERFVILSVDKALKYHTTILDGDGNVIAVVSEIGRKPADYGEFDNGQFLFSCRLTERIENIRQIQAFLMELKMKLFI